MPGILTANIPPRTSSPALSAQFSFLVELCPFISATVLTYAIFTFLFILTSPVYTQVLMVWFCSSERGKNGTFFHLHRMHGCIEEQLNKSHLVWRRRIHWKIQLATLYCSMAEWRHVMKKTGWNSNFEFVITILEYWRTKKYRWREKAYILKGVGIRLYILMCPLYSEHGI